MNRTHSKPPMTEDEAVAFIAEMKHGTKVKPQIALIRYALGELGNLSDAARNVYSARLKELGGAP